MIFRRYQMSIRALLFFIGRNRCGAAVAACLARAAGEWCVVPGPCRMTRAVVLLLAACLFVAQAGRAAEIDSVTTRGVRLENSLGEINRIFNERIRQGIDKANARQDDIEDLDPDEFCDEEVLYTELRKAIFQSFTAAWGLKGYELDQQLRKLLAAYSYSLSLNDSIYRDINYLEGFSLNLKELSDVIDLNGHLVGLDKFGHFFAEGWRYFEMTREDGKTLAEALSWGRDQEEGVYGYRTTGIFSYADLTANFHGYRFWNRILGKERDPLKKGIGRLLEKPYVGCELQIIDSLRYLKIVRAWEPRASFDFSAYVDGMWDEGNNCNSYADPVIESKVLVRIRDINPSYRCPRLPQACIEAQEEYGPYAKQLLHPACLTATRR